MREMLTAVIATNPCTQLPGGQLACWFNDSSLAMTPVGFDTIEPGAFRRQLADDNSHAPVLFCLSVVSPNPPLHFMANMPRGIVPDQQPRLLSLLLQVFQDPPQEVESERRHWPALDKPQPELFRVGSQYPITRKGFRIRVCLLGAPLLQAKWCPLCPAVHPRVGQARPPDFIGIAKH